MDAAERFFAELGFGEVSTSKIAREAGVSQSQIHYHFKTKRKLWRAVFQRPFEEYFEIQSSTFGKSELEGADMLEASIRVYYSFFRNNPLFVKLLGRAQLDNKYRIVGEILVRSGRQVGDYPILVKMNGYDGRKKGMTTGEAF